MGWLTLQYKTANGELSDQTEIYGDPAQAGIDYNATAGTLTWEDGDSTDKIITVPTIDQGIFQPDFGVFFDVDISAPTGGATLGPDASIIVAESLDVFSLTSAPTVTRVDQHSVCLPVHD